MEYIPKVTMRKHYYWDTIGFPPLNYTISAHATSVPSEADITDNTRVGDTAQTIQTSGDGIEG
jgi:hypothetical protein